MKVNVFRFNIFFAFAASGLTLDAAPTRYSYYDGSDQATMREMRDSLDDLRRDVSNQEAEMKVFDEKLNTIQSTLETLCRQVNEVKQSSRESVRNSSKELEGKFNSFDPVVKGVSGDLKMLQRQVNEALDQYKARLAGLEKTGDIQNRNIEHLQAAIASLMELLQVKDEVKTTASDQKGKNYKVKAGDSLEKIAKLHGVSILSLKEINNLQTDRIIVGQNLWIPQK